MITDPSLKIIINRLTTTAKLWELPENYREVTIAGPAEASRDQAVVLLRRYNPKLPIKATPEEIVDLYYQEAGREGLRWDIVFCRPSETGFLVQGTVVPEQNNFCGLGTTSATVRGAYFPTPRDGVRAHVQHLMAYTTDRLPATPVIDPRYYLGCTKERSRTDSTPAGPSSTANGPPAVIMRRRSESPRTDEEDHRHFRQ